MKCQIGAKKEEEEKKEAISSEQANKIQSIVKKINEANTEPVKIDEATEQ